MSLEGKNKLSPPCLKLRTPPAMLIGAKASARPYFLFFRSQFSGQLTGSPRTS